MKNTSSGQDLLILLIVVPLSIIFSGWTVTVLWDWFIVTTFKLAPLTIAQGLGLSLVLGYFTHQHQESKERETKDWVVLCFSKPIASLVLGWITHLFM